MVRFKKLFMCNGDQKKVNKMKKIVVIVTLIFCIGALFAQALAEKKDENWTKRCSVNEETSVEHCEIFQRLIMKDSGQRVVEFALSTNPDSETGRGVIIMPLGIMLEPGVELNVDEKHSYKFNARYCLMQGCVAYITLDEEILSVLKKGNTAKIVFTVQDYRKVAFTLNLTGFTKALKQLS